VRLKQEDPERFVHSLPFIRSIPDWLILQRDMRVPCDAYEMIWIGADGTVQLCDAALKLGNLHERPLREILFGEAHRDAARAAFRLDCPNCMCKVDSRIQKHAPSLRRYGGGGDGEPPPGPSAE
jgi:sulfatase maturation enzyme AslB (radical SAM superfamily)